MCCHIRLLRFIQDLDKKSEEDFLFQLKTYFVADFLSAVGQFVQFAIVGFWGYIPVAVWFLVDAFAGLYIVTFDREKHVGLPQIFLDLNTASNVLSFLLFWAVRVYVLYAIQGGFRDNIATGIVGAFVTTMRLLKLFIIHGYRRFSLENKLQKDDGNGANGNGKATDLTTTKDPIEEVAIDVELVAKIAT